jgi:hypothetical protein
MLISLPHVTNMNRLMLAIAVFAMLGCAGCATWANEPCEYCFPNRGPGGGER